MEGFGAISEIFFFFFFPQSQKEREGAANNLSSRCALIFFFRRLRAREKNDVLTDEKEKKADRLCSLHLFNYLSLLLAQTFKTLT